MKHITIAVLALGAGVALGLSEAQAKLRKHLLTPVEGRKGWYTTTGPVQFKVGEQIETDAGLPKGLAEAVEDLQCAQRESKAKAKAAEEAAKTEAAAKAAEEAQALADAVAKATEKA